MIAFLVCICIAHTALIVVAVMAFFGLGPFHYDYEKNFHKKL